MAGGTVPGFWFGNHRRRLAHDGVRSTVGKRSPSVQALRKGFSGVFDLLPLQEMVLANRIISLTKLWLFFFVTFSVRDRAC